ncbi:MAG TPA: LamG-like jellyroll fold domain-containing protein [Candidatus Kapabacteria bacterium]|nr:LamG-like jellyroll fold domain-containing protein [Candidatus Kapabacteria bacterium]
MKNIRFIILSLAFATCVYAQSSDVTITYDKDTACNNESVYLSVSGGAPGNALQFNGTSDHVTLPLIDASHGTGLTVEAWVNVTSAISARYQNIIRQSGGNSGGGYPNWMLEFQNSNSPDLAFGINAGGGYTEMQYPINPSDFSGVWKHVAGTYDGAFMRLYVDGVLVDSTAKSGAVGFVGSDHSIGSNANYFEFYQGEIDEVRVWDVARTKGEIGVARSFYVGPTPDLLGEWSMDECAGSVVKDRSGNGNDGVLSDSSTMRVEPSTAPVGPIYVWSPATGLSRTVGPKAIAYITKTITYTVQALGTADCKPGSASVTITDTCSGLIVTAASDTICKNDSTLMTVVGAHKGNALQFDGVFDHVQLPVIDLSKGTGFTVEVWVNVTDIAFSQYQNIVRQSGGDSTTEGLPNWLLEFLNGESSALAFGVHAGGVFSQIVYPLTPDFAGNWHHIAGTYDGAFLRLYVDGALVDSTQFTGSLDFIGAYNSIGSNANVIEFYKGQIDEVRLWDVARTRAQIRQAMYSAIGPNEVHLKAEWAMDDCSGTTVSDITGDGYDGTLTDTAMRVAPSGSPVKPFYIWNPATGLDPAWGDTIYADPQKTTTYTVSALGANCTSLEGVQTIIVENCDGVNEQIYSPKSPALFVYPNPAHGAINVQYNAGVITDLTIRLVNVLGETVYSESYSRFFGAYNRNVDVSNLSSGTYYLQVMTDQGTVSKNIVLK